MSKYIVSIIILFKILTQTAAQDIIIGEQQILHSDILHEKRAIWVHLPKQYHTEKYATSRYPVLYVLDGERHFYQLVATTDALSGDLYTYMPETIVIGLVNTDRSRDMTPTNDTIQHNGIPMHGTSGGADKFLKFITKELMQHVDNKYRTDGFNILSGHSFGGLFTIYALLNDAGSFKAYLAHDPSLWWDKSTVLSKAEHKLSQLDLSGKTLYLSIANADTTEADRFKHTDNIKAFKALAEKENSSGLRFYSNFFAKEDHGTIPLPANYEGLRTLFKGITLPVKKVPHDTNLITDTYTQLSENMGNTIIPQAHILDNMADYCKRVHKPEAELQIRQIYAANYPNSAYAHFKLAHYYTAHHKQILSKKHLNIAINLAPDSKAKFQKEITQKLNKK